MCETLLLANPDINTLRPVRSRASTRVPRTRTASRVFAAVVLRGLAMSLLLICRVMPYAFCLVTRKQRRLLG